MSVIGCSSSSESIEFHEKTELLKEPALQNVGNPEMIIMLLPEGTQVKILEKEYGKDFLAYKVETDEGVVGYVLHTKHMTIKVSN